MGRKKEVSFVDSATVAQAEADLRGLGEGKVAKRLLAIIAVGREKRLQEVADILRVTRQSVYRWIGRYRRQGLRGLYDRPKGHRRKRLSDPQEQEIQRWLVEGKDAGGGFQRWTVDKMKMAVEKQFGVGLSRTRLWVLMRAWGF
ncbi:helix-turn-helix domain containing protein, partial [Candidatus Sumerlaeota bacterium]|nr:helix-turn-helix domain containing protein [Candidatus Sumerlaeota bacterium]